MYKFKRCPKCNTQIRYKDIIDLYEVKDSCAIWTCFQCGNKERISNDELIIRCQVERKSLSLRA